MEKYRNAAIEGAIEEAIENLKTMQEGDTYVYLSRKDGDENVFACCHGTMDAELKLMAGMTKAIEQILQGNAEVSEVFDE